MNEKNDERVYPVKYPVAFHTVDMACTRCRREIGNEEPADGPEVLLIKKHAELGGTYERFPGGFVDPEKDDSAEDASKRELAEEVGKFETAYPIYLCSKKIDDPRYRDSAHKIITSFYEVPYLWGHENNGTDDAAYTKWRTLRELKDNTELRNPIHEWLFQALFKKYGIN